MGTENENPSGLNIGNLAPDFTSLNISTNIRFNMKTAIKQHNGILVNFYRGSW